MSERSTTGFVAFVGLGDIGLPMAERLLDCGIELAVTNRTSSKADALLDRGACWFETPAELATASDVVISCLHGPDADRAVFLGPRGLLEGDVSGTLLINTSTIGPDVARELSAAAADRGASYVDAALMGGGRQAARNGSLVMPIGGAADHVARAASVLAMLAETVDHVGPIGAAQVVKLGNNAQIAVHAVALAEAVRFALAGGADPEALARLWPRGSSHSRAMDLYLNAMLERRFEHRGALRTLAKDLDLAAAFAASVDEPSLTAEAAREAFRRALEAGFGDLDVPTLVAAPGEITPASGAGPP